MTASFRPRLWPLIAGATLVVLSFTSLPAAAQYASDSYGGSESASSRADGYGNGENRYVPRGDTYPPPGGYNSNAAPAPARDTYGRNSARTDAYSANSYGGGDAYSPREDAYAPRGDTYSRANNSYAARGNSYRGGGNRDYTEPGEPYDGGGYGTPYTPPPADGTYQDAPPHQANTYDQNEIVAAGHGFFGAISQGLASAVEYVFRNQGRPNGYILGEDAGGAFVVGLRYGEGRLYTKDAGDHKVFWQGPSVGYDAGAEGSKAMVLVYNLSDPSEIYRRFGGVQGSAYLVGGLSVQFQKYGDITLAVIRSGVGVRLGASVGYLKYTRAPTWNPL